MYKLFSRLALPVAFLSLLVAFAQSPILAMDDAARKAAAVQMVANMKAAKRRFDDLRYKTRLQIAAGEFFIEALKPQERQVYAAFAKAHASINPETRTMDTVINSIIADAKIKAQRSTLFRSLDPIEKGDIILCITAASISFKKGDTNTYRIDAIEFSELQKIFDLAMSDETVSQSASDKK